MSDDDARTENGFELRGVFYRWHLSDTGKDLMLIDRFTAMPFDEFFEVIEDEFDRSRAPMLLAMMATSIRAKNPEWSVERITRLVMDTNLGEVAFVAVDDEEDTRPPLADVRAIGPPTPDIGISPSSDSSESSVQTEDSHSATSSGIRP